MLPTPFAGLSLEQLTPREREVLGLIVQHMTNKQVARELGIAETTVDKHLKNIRQKFGTRDRYETARVAQLLEGWENPYPQIPSGDETTKHSADPLADLPRTAEFRLSDVLAIGQSDFPEIPAPKGLEALDERFGKAWRIAAIPTIALILAMVVICVLAIAWMSSRIF